MASTKGSVRAVPVEHDDEPPSPEEVVKRAAYDPTYKPERAPELREWNEKHKDNVYHKWYWQHYNEQQRLRNIIKTLATMRDAIISTDSRDLAFIAYETGALHHWHERLNDVANGMLRCATLLLQDPNQVLVKHYRMPRELLEKVAAKNKVKHVRDTLKWVDTMDYLKRVDTPETHRWLVWYFMTYKAVAYDDVCLDINFDVMRAVKNFAKARPESNLEAEQCARESETSPSRTFEAATTSSATAAPASTSSTTRTSTTCAATILSLSGAVNGC